MTAPAWPGPGVGRGPERLAILGATGGIGGYLLSWAVDAGYPVHVLARRPEAVPGRPGVTVTRGDATDPAAVADVVASADAVLSALGPRGAKTPGLLGAAASAVTQAMVKRARGRGPGGYRRGDRGQQVPGQEDRGAAGGQQEHRDHGDRRDASDPAKPTHAQRPAATPRGTPTTRAISSVSVGIWPATTGSASSPMYASLAMIPGWAEISLMGWATGIPGRMPGTLTKASLALFATR
jgi:NAD(P)H-binding